MRLNLSLGVLAAAQLAASLLMQLAVLAAVGIGPASDAFVAAQSVPATLLAVLSMSLQSVWQPRLAVLVEDEPAWRYTLRLALGQSMLVLLVPTFALAATSRWWLQWLFPGFAAQPLQTAVSISGPLFAATLLNGLSAVLVTGQRGRGRFLSGEAVAIVCTLIALLLVMLLVPRLGVTAAAWIMLARAAAMLAAMHLLTTPSYPRVRAAIAEREMWSRLRPLVLGSSIYKSAPLVDRFWSSQAGSGGVTVFNLAQLGMGAIATVLERAVCMPMAPGIARMVDAHDFDGVRAAYRKSVWRITGLCLAVGAALFLSYPLWPFLLALLLKIDAQSSALLWKICLLLLGFVHVAASGTVVVAGFYAMGDTTTPALVGVVGFVAGVAAKSLGFIGFGLVGLAAATSLYYLLNLAVLCALLERTLTARHASR